MLEAAGKFYAEALCVLAFHLKHAGGQGVDDLVQDPTSKGRNASRKLSATIGLDWIEQNLLIKVKLPKHHKMKRRTVLQDSCVLPFYDQLHREVVNGEGSS